MFKDETLRAGCDHAGSFDRVLGFVCRAFDYGEFYVRVFARQMLEAGVVDVEQFNSLYAKPNGGYGIDPLPTSNFSSTDAEKFLTPIPWKTGRWFLNAFMLLSGVMVILSGVEAFAVARGLMREGRI
jgi:hypothetical protein